MNNFNDRPTGLVHDAYLWIKYQVESIEAPRRISWDDLNDKFGTEHETLIVFQGAFVEALTKLESIYPALKAEITVDGLILHPALLP